MARGVEDLPTITASLIAGRWYVVVVPVVVPKSEDQWEDAITDQSR